MASTNGNYDVRFTFDNGNAGPGHFRLPVTVGPTSKERATSFADAAGTHKHMENVEPPSVAAPPVTDGRV